MKENWMVQIFRNVNSSIMTNNDPDIALCFAPASQSEIATYKNSGGTENPYYPAILNKPSITYSLDLKSFTTKTGNVTLNIANFDLGNGNKLLEELDHEYLNAHVNILSVLDDDTTNANALQIFSGKISSFAYKNNVIILSIITDRPFHNVSIPNTKSSGVVSEKYVPVVYGEYTANGSSTTHSTGLFPCPFLRNDGANMIYMLPKGATSGSDKLEFYDPQMQRFMELTNSTTSPATIDDVSTLQVPKEMLRTFNTMPSEILNVAGTLNQATYSSGHDISQSGNVSDAYDGDNSDGVTFSSSTGIEESETAYITFRIKTPQVTGKIDTLKIYLDGGASTTATEANSSTGTNLASGDGFFLNINKTQSGNMASTTGDVELMGTNSSPLVNNASFNLASYVNGTTITSLLEDGSLPDDLYLTFRWSRANDETDQDPHLDAFSATLDNVYFQIVAKNDLDNESMASQLFNAGVDTLYLGRDVYTKTYQASSSANDSTSVVDNPISIHRELLKDQLSIDYASAGEVASGGYDTLVDLRDDSAGTEWNARVSVLQPQSLEGLLNRLQYEGCFFFEFSPQRQQVGIVANTARMRYFTIANSPSADVNLSEVDISDYQIGITKVQDLETNISVNYNNHPAENRHLATQSYTNTDTGGGKAHSQIYDQASHQKQEFELAFLYGAVEGVGSNRNSDWIGFRSSLFGEYKTTIDCKIINPDKYAMLQVGDILDFGDTTFGNLGSPYNEISDTFDSMVAMPTRLFADQWTNKKFIITKLKREIGSVDISCREA